MSASGPLQLHTELSADLALRLRVLGDTRHAAITNRASAWAETRQLPVTERREEVSNSVADLNADIAGQEMEIEALRVELHHIEIALKYTKD